MSNMISRTILFTVMALIAFAANSVLCRLALADHAIDASSFTVIRLLSGAVMLMLIVALRQTDRKSAARGSWSASLMLFIYAATFSFAYTSLDTGTGALILFAAVQVTMVLHTMLSGKRLHGLEWVGMGIAFSGFVYLILPGVSAPPATGLILMLCAGVAWGMYTLKGHASQAPLADTAYNFLRSLPLALLLAALMQQQAEYSLAGIGYAILSGSIASGIGYAIWYVALSGLSSTQAAVAQLLVPVLAAGGGVLFVSEPVTWRLAISSLLILGGILFVTLGKKHLQQQAGNEAS